MKRSVTLFVATLLLSFASGRAVFGQYPVVSRTGQGGYATDPNNILAARNGQASYAGTTAGLFNYGGNFNGQGGYATTAALLPYDGSRNGLGGPATFTAPSGFTFYPTVGTGGISTSRSVKYFSFTNPPQTTPEPARSSPLKPTAPVVPYWMSR
jgi:hypothetical protein